MYGQLGDDALVSIVHCSLRPLPQSFVCDLVVPAVLLFSGMFYGALSNSFVMTRLTFAMKVGEMLGTQASAAASALVSAVGCVDRYCVVV